LPNCAAVRGTINRAVATAGLRHVAATAYRPAGRYRHRLGCAIEAMGEGFSLTRKYGVAQSVFYDVMTDESPEFHSRCSQS
jgi:hypothetical protein